MSLRPICALLALSLIGCHTQHYVVLDEAPLYADAQGSRVVATLPRLHHQPLTRSPERVGARVRLEYRGAQGYAPREAVQLFRYLDPEWDGGDERRVEIGRALRGAQVHAVGQEWAPGVQEAVRRGQVRAGMTRQQVEVAWGWPATVEPDPDSGGERWIYRSQSTQTLQRYFNDPFTFPSANLTMSGARMGAFACTRFGGFAAPWGYAHTSWVEIRLDVTEERTVVVDAAGSVLGVRVRRYLNDA